VNGISCSRGATSRCSNGARSAGAWARVCRSCWRCRRSAAGLAADAPAWRNARPQALASDLSSTRPGSRRWRDARETGCREKDAPQVLPSGLAGSSVSRSSPGRAVFQGRPVRSEAGHLVAKRSGRSWVIPEGPPRNCTEDAGSVVAHDDRASRTIGDGHPGRNVLLVTGE